MVQEAGYVGAMGRGSAQCESCCGGNHCEADVCGTSLPLLYSRKEKERKFESWTIIDKRLASKEKKTRTTFFKTFC
jgi:hypothetical protein